MAAQGAAARSGCARASRGRSRSRASAIATRWRLQIIDNGPGIPDEMRERDLLSAGLGPRRRQRARPHARAELHHRSTTARSTFESRPGQHRASRSCCRCRRGRRRNRRHSMKPVWIIDDDRSIRWVFEKALTRENIAFKTFASAQRSARRARRRDAAGPGERHPHARRVGPRAAAEGRRSAIPTVPVIIMTAYSDLESAVAAFQGGAYEYLPKPFDVDHAVELIRRALDESRARGRGRSSRWRRRPRSSARRRRCRKCSAPSAGCRSRTRRC